MKDNVSNDQYKSNNSCYASMLTLTGALKAQKLLGLNAIPSNVVKMQMHEQKRGCAYRLAFSCSQEKNIRMIFEREKIKVKGWNGEF